MKQLTTWSKGLSLIKRTATIAGVTFLSLTVLGAVNQPPSSPASTTTKVTTVVDTEPRAKPVRVETKSVLTTDAVPFTSSTINDPALAQGLSEVRTAGVTGERTITYEVTYTDNVETSRTQISDRITTQPVNEVVAKGTRISQPDCPNGTYRNSQGNTVCSPYESSTAPAGATAECSDGTYSFSQSRRGTCSHHGGVARWL